MRLRPIEHLEKPSTKMQNAHTRKIAYTFFLYFTTDLQRKPNRRFFKTEPKPNRTCGFSQNRTETKLEKSFPHIPSIKSQKAVCIYYTASIIHIRMQKNRVKNTSINQSIKQSRHICIAPTSPAN